MTRGGFAIRPRVALGLIALTALAIRLLHVASYDPEPSNDMAVYVEMAVKRLSLANLFTMDGICWFPPGYALFLKPFFLLLAPSAALRAVQIAQAALGAWTCVLIYHLARRLHSRRAGLVAAALTCFFPHFLFYSSVHMSENLFVPLYYAALLLFLRSAQRPVRGRLYRAGLVAAAATLVRPAAVSLAPAALLASWRGGGTWRSRAAALAWILAGGLTLIAPWAIRNTIAYDHFVLLAPNGPFNLAIGNHPEATGTYTDPPSISGDIWERMEDFRLQAVGFVTNDPWGALFNVLRLKWRSFWDLIPPWPLYSSNPNLFYGELWFPMAPWRAVFLLGLVGAGASVARGGLLRWTTLACAAAYAAFYMIYFGNPRLRYPMEGYFLAAAGAGVVVLAAQVPRLRRAKAAVWAVAAGLVLAAVLVESAVSAAGNRAFLRSPESRIASGDQIPVINQRPPFSIFGEAPLPLDRRRGRYLVMQFTAFRQGPHRDTPANGMVQIVYLDARGRTGHWLDNSAYYLEALPADRWVTVRFKSLIPPAAASCRVMLTPDRWSPDVLILDQPVLRYARGNDLALEFLHPYLRYAE